MLRAFEQILFEPRSPAQIEQLARKILDYSRMNRKGSELVVIDVRDMAARFREPRRNVRQSLERLEEQGTVERTLSKDHWEMTSRVLPPIRVTYNPPRISGPSPKMPANPPPGWAELQNRAHKAKDAREFNEVVNQMNRLLSAHEKAAGNGHGADQPSPSPGEKKP